MANGKEDDLKPTFRVRFTICSNTIDNEVRASESHNQNCSEALIGDRKNLNSANKVDGKKLFKFIQPQNHKSSLIVNLSGSGKGNDNQQEYYENHLFISPNLNQAEVTPSSPLNLTSESSFVSGDSSENYLNNLGDSLSFNSTMSQGCNFINSLMSASRHRSASVTPQAPVPKVTDPRVDSGVRASSTDDLDRSNQRNSDTSHLIARASDETICNPDATQINTDFGYIQHADLNMMRPLQIDIDEQSDIDNVSYSNLFDTDDTLPPELSELHLLDECKNLENQVAYWERKVDDLERKRIEREDVPRTLVESVLNQRKTLRDLEFQIYKLDLEESDLQIHSLSPHMQDKSDSIPNCLSYGRIDSQLCQSNLDNRMMVDYENPLGSRLTTSRIGSQLRPGQENTADILDAIPPSGALQHRQYLSRASTGTDSSEYSQLPIYDKHHHRISSNVQAIVSSDDSNMSADNSHEVQVQRRDHQYHSNNYRNHIRQSSIRNMGQQLYMQMDTVNQGSPSCLDINRNRDGSRQRASPIRPDHFKDEFRSPQTISKQDSSSTTSSGSPLR